MKLSYAILSLSFMLLVATTNAQYDSSESGDDPSNIYTYNNIDYSIVPSQGSMPDSEGAQFHTYRSEPASMVVNGQPISYRQNSAATNSLWIQVSNQQVQQAQCSIFTQLKLVAYSIGGTAIMTEVYPDGHSMQSQYYFQPGYNEIVFAPDVLGRHTLGYEVYGQLSNMVIIDVIAQDQAAKQPSPDIGTANSITWNFETGDLGGWTKTGDAFDNAPTASGPAHIGWMQINNQGTYWISSEHESKGTLTSQPFVINGNKISFLVGGSRYNWFGASNRDLGCYVALIIDESAVEVASGNDSGSMEQIEWDVSEYRGKMAEIQLVDDGSTGHISFDDVRFDVQPTMFQRFTIREGESIQAAIDRANTGDLIEVYSGTYQENLNLNKKLNLYGVDTGDGNPVIDARNLGSAITISADGVDLGWFNVTNSRLDAGIKVYSSWNSIHDIVASNNYIGMLLSQNSHNTLNSIKINGNIEGSTYGGLLLEESSNNAISGIDVLTSDIGINIRKSRGNEISLWKDPRVRENRITGNRIGIQLSNSYDNILEWNDLTGNEASAFDDGNNQWSCNTYDEVETSSPLGSSTYSIPGGSNIDKSANAPLSIPMKNKMGKAPNKKHEKEK